jgi:anti-sigma B factor antagonist
MATNPTYIPAPLLKLDSSTANHCTTVRCEGRLTAETSGYFNDTLRKLIQRSARIILELGDVEYMDSSGLGTVMGIYASARKADCDFSLLNLSPRVMELLRVSKLTSVLKIEGNLL